MSISHNMNMQKTVCRFCGASSVVFFRQEDLPVVANLLCKSLSSSLRIPKGTLAMAGCLSCGLIWNSQFDPSLLAYTPQYENNQSYSKAYTEHMDDVLKILKQHFPETFSLLEFGCGQGDFLKRAMSFFGQRLEAAIGFDPALRENGVFGSMTLVSCPFSPDKIPAGILPTVAIGRHALTYMDPISFIKDLALYPSINSLVIETPDADWILKNNAYYDLAYELREFYRKETLEFILNSAGFEPRHCYHLFDARYILMIAQKDKTSSTKTVNTKHYEDQLKRFSQHYSQISHNWKKIIDELKEKNLVIALWGAGARAIAFLSMISGKEKLFSCVIDINPLKCGGYVPGYGLPIISPYEAKRNGVEAIIIMNSIYSDEIKDTCKDLEFSVEFLSL